MKEQMVMSLASPYQYNAYQTVTTVSDMSITKLHRTLMWDLQGHNPLNRQPVLAAVA